MLQLCIWPEPATVMLLGSSKSFPLNRNAGKINVLVWKKEKKLHGMYNLLKHLVEEFTLKNNFSKHHNILFNVVLDQETVLELSLFASDDKITGFS